MSIDGFYTEEVISNARATLEDDKTLSSPSSRAVIEVLLLVVSSLVNRLGLNSSNCSKPPSSDPNREKKFRKKGCNKSGGQNGHKVTTLEKYNKPDQLHTINIDRRLLPPGNYHDGRYPD